jgi:hypothetical protein
MVIKLGVATLPAAAWGSVIRLVIQFPSALWDPSRGSGTIQQVSRVVCSNIILTA